MVSADADKLNYLHAPLVPPLRGLLSKAKLGVVAGLQFYRIIVPLCCRYNPLLCMGIRKAASCQRLPQVSFADSPLRGGTRAYAKIIIRPVKPDTFIINYPLSIINFPTRLHVVLPVISACTNCPIRLSSPWSRTSLPPSVRAVRQPSSVPSTRTRQVLPT